MRRNQDNFCYQDQSDSERERKKREWKKGIEGQKEREKEMREGEKK